MMSLTGLLARKRSLGWRISMAVCIGATVFLLRLLLSLSLQELAPFAFQMPALLLIGLLCGMRIGTVALLAMLCGNLLFVPDGTFTDPAAHVASYLTLSSFLVNGFALCLIAAALRGTVGTLQGTRDALEESARSREGALATLEALLAHAPIGFGFFDRERRYIRINEALAEIHGIPIAAHLGRTIAELLPDYAARIEPLVQQVFATDAVIADVEVSGQTPAQPGVTRYWLSAFFPVRDAAGTVTAVGVAVVEITARKLAEQAVEDSARRFSNLAEALPQMVWTADAQGKSDYYNARWSEFTGSAGESFEWQAFLHPEERDDTLGTWQVALGSGEPFSRESRLRAAAGDYQWFLCRAVPVRDAAGKVERWFGSCTDISQIVTARETMARSREELELMVVQRTIELGDANARLVAEIEERIKAEEQLRQAQKMEAVGQLTGGIAHDFNNLLTIIIGNLEAAERRIEPHQTQIASFLDYSRQGALRAATLTQRLLAFSRRQPLDPKPTDINRLVTGMSEMLRRTLGEKVLVETVLAGGLWWAEVDPNQLESAILNLAVNARDAMPAGGKLTIETANAHLDEAYAASHAEVVPGQYVSVCVSDSGEGMSGETRERAFEPFFTTKGPSEGTGLGLSQVYGFVKQSGGHVKIYSERGDGTTVKLYVPRQATTQPAPSFAEPRRQRAAAGAGHTILVAEDDEGVRRYSVDVLEDLGYRVLQAASGAAALEILAGTHPVDLLFTDVVLGGSMDGRQLVDAARRLRPGLRVLFTTAFARNAIVHNGRLDAGVQLLTKPFTHVELAGKVRTVLEQPEPRGAALLVEDEPFVAMVARQILEDEGFDVTVASNAGGALSYMEQSGAGLAMAVVDLGLPDMRGEELVKRLLALRADLPILIASGYGTGELESLLGSGPRMAALPKPYDAAALRRALRALGFQVED